MKRPAAYIAGTGHAVPRRAMTNQDIAALGIETTDEWIVERTGIRQRYIAAPDETLTALSAQAARAAMEQAGVQPGEIDVIVLGTASPDHLLPATAVEVQAALGCTRAAAFDLGAACSGWLYSAIVAESLIAAGTADTVLVIGAEKLSSIINSAGCDDPAGRREKQWEKQWELAIGAGRYRTRQDLDGTGATGAGPLREGAWTADPAGDADYSGWKPACFTMSAKRASEPSKNRRNCSGVLPSGSTLSARSRSFVAGSRITCATSCCSRATIDAGVRAG